MIEDVLSGVGGNGTANYIPKWEDEDTIGDSVIYQNGTSIGVGTNNPGQNLQIHQADSDVNYLEFTNTTAATGTLVGLNAAEEFILWHRHNSDMVFATNAVEKMRIENGGNVGIGTNAPAKLLTVRSTTSPIIGLYSAYADSNARNWSIGTNNAAYGDFTISASAANGGNPTAIKLSILKDGKVGIGTTNPIYTLHVKAAQGIVRTDSTTGTNRSGFQMANTGGTGFIMATSSAGNGVLTTGGLAYALQINKSGGSTDAWNAVQIGTKDIARMTIDESGNVGIGTNNPTGKFQIGANYTIPGTSYGGDDIYIANTGSHANYDPYVYNTDDFRALITITDGTTTGPTKPGLILYNDDTTAGGFSPMLLGIVTGKHKDRS